VVFSGQVERVYVSWTYNNAYVAMKFSRKWYWNDQLIVLREDGIWDGTTWRIDGTSEYTWLNPAVFGPGHSHLLSGSYTVELYIGDRLEQRGSFAILR